LGDHQAKKGSGFAKTDVAGLPVLFDSLSKVRNRPRHMIFSPGVNSNRREFFRAGARYGLLGILAVVAALTGAKRRLSGQHCVNRGLCNACAVFESCELPQALSAKQAKPGGVR
jgi:hypothetical protein